MTSDRSQSGKLERTLGLPAALAIGIGTMVGAGIFVFPGIAAGHAGPAAILSFVLAGLIALLVALSTAELATAMPESGGGYYFVSRTFGPVPGMIVGVSQWIGLIFASSFYLVGFGEYAVQFLSEFDLSLGDPVVLIALISGVFLTAINLVGTRRAGKLQNHIVVSLTAVLGLLFLYGLLQATGIIGADRIPEAFAPKGIFPVFTTAALIFTSYLGFVQIATVAGEIREPHRNLPRALMGSVLIVSALYMVALFVSTSLFSSGQLAEMGETAMVEVGRKLIGATGGLVITGAGLLATLSSANASVLSSSRAVYALSRDGMVPRFISRINDRFGTPHLALLVVGVPIASLTLLGRIEVLAEVASLLHLVIYGLICIALIVLRRRRPLWYAPTFMVPGAPFLPALGTLACFGLIALMQPLSLAIGFGILLGAMAWYAVFARGQALTPPQPPHIIPGLREPRIMMPVEVSEPPQLPHLLLDAFRNLKLFLLGYKIVPEQTSPQQASEESEGEEQEALDEITDEVAGKGIDVTSQLTYTPDLAASLDKYIRDHNCQAVLTPKPMQSLRRLLVPIYHSDQVNRRLNTILRDLAGSSGLPVTLLVLESGEKESEAATSLEALQRYAIQQLMRVGLSSKQIRSNRVGVSSLVEAVEQIAEDDDLVILSESGKEPRDQLFTTILEEMQEAVSCPTLVILRNEQEEAEEKA